MVCTSVRMLVPCQVNISGSQQLNLSTSNAAARTLMVLSTGRFTLFDAGEALHG